MDVAADASSAIAAAADPYNHAGSTANETRDAVAFTCNAARHAACLRQPDMHATTQVLTSRRPKHTWVLMLAALLVVDAARCAIEPPWCATLPRAALAAAASSAMRLAAIARPR